MPSVAGCRSFDDSRCAALTWCDRSRRPARPGLSFIEIAPPAGISFGGRFRTVIERVEGIIVLLMCIVLIILKARGNEPKSFEYAKTGSRVTKPIKAGAKAKSGLSAKNSSNCGTQQESASLELPFEGRQARGRNAVIRERLQSKRWLRWRSARGPAEARARAASRILNALREFVHASSIRRSPSFELDGGPSVFVTRS